MTMIRVSLAVVCLGLFVQSLHAAEWAQWRGANGDGVWSESGLIERFPEEQIKLRWRTPINAGYSGPTVADGRVLVTDRVKRPNPLERTLCLDWETGRILWAHSYACEYGRTGYPAGPRASVAIDEGRAYSLGTMGHLHCLDLKDGQVLWKKTPGVDYEVRVPIWGISASPVIVGSTLVVQIGAADGACVVGLDKVTGQERWRALDDKASYSTPFLIQQAGKSVLVCWTGDNVVGLDPADGTVYWKHPFAPRKMVINVPTPVVANNRLFVTGFYDGALMLTLRQDEPAVDRLWRRIGANERNTDALHCMMSTPILQGDHIYGVDSYGQLRCLDARTGDRLWEDLTATPPARWSNIHMVRGTDGRVWMFNERGELLIGRLAPDGFTEISRAKLIDPTTEQLGQRGGVCWSHPAYAYRHIFARNDRELVCASLAGE